MSVSTLPVRPRLVTPEPAKNEFAILGAEVREAAGNVRALAERINRALGGPYSTSEALSAAEYQATCLASEARALANAIRKAGRS